ncbi:leucine-rich repeat protein [Porcipelethomonas sp.]|uniref:leucine-rich repeat protein n=1 Tax=Porcipelethomonas sp. TaxID=2981675 RepID=UPI003EF9C8FD
MKAKKITVACLAAGLTLVGTAGLIAYAAGNPYESYKSAVVNTIGEDNLTAHAAVQMKQNGKVIASGNAVYEKSAGVQYSSVVADVAGQSMIQEEYSDGNVKIKSDGSKYTEKNRKEKHDESEATYDPFLTIEKVDADEDGIFDYAYISNCEAAAKSVVIPSEVDGIPVTEIGFGAFMDTNLASITISGNIKTIGAIAFSFCSNLTIVTIDENVTKIETGAFSDCNSLHNVTIKNPECEISDDPDVFTYGCIISGYDNSTAQAYAQKYGYAFESLGEAPEVIKGDANGDEEVDVRDAAFIARKLAERKVNEIPDSADFNEDGKINVRDAAAIARYMANKFTS